MSSNTTRSAVVRLLIFAGAVLSVTALFGCGSDDPARVDPIEVIIPITPGQYQIFSEVITCPDTSGMVDTVSVDTLDIACEFNLTAFVENTDDDIPLSVTSENVVQTGNNYDIEMEFRLDYLPCRIYFTMELTGTVTDTTFYFEGRTYQSRVQGQDSIYQTFCENQYAVACTTMTVFDAVYVAPDTTGACD